MRIPDQLLHCRYDVNLTLQVADANFVVCELSSKGTVLVQYSVFSILSAVYYYHTKVTPKFQRKLHWKLEPSSALAVVWRSAPVISPVSWGGRRSFIAQSFPTHASSSLPSQLTSTNLTVNAEALGDSGSRGQLGESVCAGFKRRGGRGKQEGRVGFPGSVCLCWTVAPGSQGQGKC